jgi:hypothetical protein
MSTRRDFLKHSDAAGLGAATLGVTLNSANAQVPGSLSSSGSAAAQGATAGKVRDSGPGVAQAATEEFAETGDLAGVRTVTRLHGNPT